MSTTTDASKRDQALKAITGLKEDMEKLKNLLAPISEKTDLENLIKSMSEHLPSLDAHFNVQRDRLGTKWGMPSSANDATTRVNAALTTLQTLTGKSSKLIDAIKSLAPIEKMLGEMNNAIETLNGHLSSTS